MNYKKILAGIALLACMWVPVRVEALEQVMVVASFNSDPAPIMNPYSPSSWGDLLLANRGQLASISFSVSDNQSTVTWTATPESVGTDYSPANPNLGALSSSGGTLTDVQVTPGESSKVNLTYYAPASTTGFVYVTLTANDGFNTTVRKVLIYVM